MRTQIVCLALLAAALPLGAQPPAAEDGGKDAEVQRLRTDMARSLQKEAEKLLEEGQPAEAAEKLRRALDLALGKITPLTEKARAERIAALRKEFAADIAEAGRLRAKGDLFGAYEQVIKALYIDPQDEPARELARELRILAAKAYRRYLEQVRPGGRTQQSVENPWQGVSPLDGPADRELRKRLAAPMSSAPLRNTTLKDAVAALQKALQRNVHVQWRRLRRAGILSDTPIDVQQGDAPVESLLAAVLSQADRASDVNVPLRYAVRDGVLVITVAEDLHQRTCLVIYDVRDLLRDIQAPALPAIPSPWAMGRIQRVRLAEELGEDSWDAMPVEDYEELDYDYESEQGQYNANELIEMLQKCVDPASWIEGSAISGSIKYYHGALIVNQSEDNQREVLGLLTMVHEVHARQRQINALVATGTRPAEVVVPPLRYKVLPAVTLADTAGAAPADARLAARLQAALPRVQFTNEKLEAALRTLAEAIGAPIQPDWQALVLAGAPPDTRVQLDLGDVPGQAALDLLLRDVSGWTGDRRLDARIRDGAVVISTRETLLHQTFPVLYDIRDLMPPAVVQPDVRPAIRREMGMTGDDDDLFGGGGVGDDDDSSFSGGTASQEDIQQIANDIIEMLQKTIDPESWIEGSPSSASVKYYHGTLLIRQNAWNHAAIARLLDGLRWALTIVEQDQDHPARPASRPASRPAETATGG